MFNSQQLLSFLIIRNRMTLMNICRNNDNKLNTKQRNGKSRFCDAKQNDVGAWGTPSNVLSFHVIPWISISKYKINNEQNPNIHIHVSLEAFDKFL